MDRSGTRGARLELEFRAGRAQRRGAARRRIEPATASRGDERWSGPARQEERPDPPAQAAAAGSRSSAASSAQNRRLPPTRTVPPLLCDGVDRRRRRSSGRRTGPGTALCERCLDFPLRHDTRWLRGDDCRRQVIVVAEVSDLGRLAISDDLDAAFVDVSSA